MENYRSQEISENINRMSLFESELEEGWILHKLIKENSPSFPKRRRVDEDSQSCRSSRTDSPVSVDSFLDESFCPTPTDSPSARVATLSDFKKHYKKDELWAAIESNYQYLMDDEIIETCRSTESDLSLDDEDLAINPNVSFQEFMQQYQELNDWLNKIQAFTHRKVMSRSEKYLNQTYHEELLQRSPRHKLLNDYARQLLKRYPALKRDVYTRLQFLNSQWQKIEQVISPSKGEQDWDTMFLDLKADIDHLWKWLQGVENRLLPLCIRSSWTTPELEEKLTEHQILQKDIESHLRVVSAVLKLGECLQNGKKEDNVVDQSISLPESLHDVSHNLEKRWHTIWLQSLEWQCRLEQAILSKKKLENSNHLLAFSPIKFWGQAPLGPANTASLTHYESSEEHVHDVGGSSLSDQGDEFDSKLQTKQEKIIGESMPGKPNDNSSVRNFNDKQTNGLCTKNDEYILSMNRENMFLEKSQLYKDNANPFKALDGKNNSGNNILSNSPLHSHKICTSKNPSKAGNINSSNQHFYQMVSLDTDWSTDSTHDDNIPKFSNYSFNKTADSGVIADISNNNIQTLGCNFSENIDKSLQIENICSTNKMCFTPEKSSTEPSSGKELSTASDSGTDKPPDMSIETTTASDSCCSSQRSKRGQRKVPKPAFSSCSSWSGGDATNTVESSCDASGEEESGDSDDSDEFSTASEDSQDNVYEPVAGHKNSLCNDKVDSAKIPRNMTLPIHREGKRNKDRPWSVIELYEQSNGLDLKPFFISESALDQLQTQEVSTPTKNNQSFDYASSTFPRLKRKEKILKSLLHASSDDTLSHAGVKRKLQNDFPKLCQILNSLSHENLRRQHHRSESESETKELTRQLQNTTVCSGSSDTESESGGAYGTAMEDTSDGEYIPGSNGSFSETAWDNYQAPLYPTVSDEATEPALQWSAEMEFEEELTALTTNNSIISQVVAKRSDEDSGKSSRLAPCEDSDSDLEDFYHVLDESSNQLKVTDHALQKKKKDSGLYLNIGRYTELLATCQTNIKCLEVIYQHLNTATPVCNGDLDRMKGLLYEWEKLRALAMERQSQCRELCLINTNLHTVYNWLQELSSLIKKEQFKGLPDAQQIIQITQEKQALFEEKMSKLNELKESVVSFKEQHPTICVDGFLMKISKCITELDSLRDKCATKLPQLQKYLLVWYEYNETKKELDQMLKQQRQQLDSIVYHLEVDLPKNQPNVQNDLRAVQKSLSFCQEKLDHLQAYRLQLTCYLDRSACAGISADYSEYRSLLFAIKQQCQKSIAKAARLNSNRAGKPRMEHTLQATTNGSLGRNHSLVFPSHISTTPSTVTSITANEETNTRSENSSSVSSISRVRPTPSSIQSTLHGLVLVCAAGLVYLADPEALEKLINFSIQLNPELAYINGPPPI
ncbi:uncharacterized protein LOC115209158 [Argonauta hians]